MNSGDTAWMLAATALVMIMLPGLALFYGGLVRRKNVLSTIMHSFFGLAIVSVVWVLVGFSLAFGPDANLFGIPGPDRQPRLRRVLQRRPRAEHGLRDDDPVRPVRGVPADVRGDHAGADHRRLRRAEAVRLLRPLHGPLVDRRLLADRALGLGDRRLAVQARRARLRRRHGRPRLVRPVGPDRRPPHRPARRQRRPDGAARHPDDRPRRRASSGSAGSASTPARPSTAGGLAASAFIVTNTAAAAATLTWVGASYLHKRKVSVVGAACGAVAGLVAITPASGFVTPGGAILIGLVAGGLCYSATLLRERLKVDDALDVFAVHGVGGVFGAIATGVLATSAIQAAYTGLIDGNPGQVVTQLVAVGATIAYAVVATFVIVKLVDVDPRHPDLGQGRGARHRPLDPRRGRLPGLSRCRRRSRPTPPLPRPTDRPAPPGGGRLRPLRRPAAWTRSRRERPTAR